MSNILAQIDSLSGYIQSTDTSLTFVTSNNLTNYNQLSGIISAQSSVYNKIYFSADNITSNANITGLRGDSDGFINLSGIYTGNSNANINGNLIVSSNIIGRGNNIINGFSRISGNSNISGNLGISGNLFTSANVTFAGNVASGSTIGTAEINTLLSSYGVPTDYAHFIAAAYISQGNNTPLSTWREFTSPSANVPTYYTTGGYNNGPYVGFNGTDEYMVGPVGNYPWASSTGETTFMLVRYDGAYTNEAFFGYTVNLTNTNAGGMYIRDNSDLGGEWMSYYYNTSGTLLFAPRNHGSLGTNVYYLFTQSWGSSGSNNFNTYLNGANVRTNTISGTYTDFTGATPYVGGIPGYNMYKNISISAIAHYNRILTTTERNNVTSYMLNNINVVPTISYSFGNLVYADFINRRMGIGMSSKPLQLFDLFGTANIFGTLIQNGRYPLVSNTVGLKIDYNYVTGVGNASSGTVTFNFVFTTIPVIILVLDDAPIGATATLQYQNATTSQFSWTSSPALGPLGTIRYLAIGT